MLGPSIYEGPDSLHYLKRTECTITNITIVPNRCPRNDQNDFFALLYQEDWLPCYLININVTTPITKPTESYLYTPQLSHETFQLAEIEIGQTYDEDQSTFKCVINTITKVCYPDKSEILIFVITTSIFSFLTIIFFTIYFKFKCCPKKKKPPLRKKSSSSSSNGTEMKLL